MNVYKANLSTFNAFKVSSYCPVLFKFAQTNDEHRTLSLDEKQRKRGQSDCTCLRVISTLFVWLCRISELWYDKLCCELTFHHEPNETQDADGLQKLIAYKKPLVHDIGVRKWRDWYSFQDCWLSTPTSKVLVNGYITVYRSITIFGWF